MRFNGHISRAYRWIFYTFVGVGISLMAILFGNNSAHADAIANQPAPAVPIPFVMPTLPTVADLQSQANSLAAQAQTAFDTAVKDTQAQAGVILGNVVKPTPAVIPTAPAPATPAVITPDIDSAITNALPASVPELVQNALDPVYNVGLSVIEGQPIRLVEPEQMDKKAPLAQQLATTADLFIIKHIAPDASKCTEETLESKTACAAAIVQKNEPDQNIGPMGEVHLIPRYGVEAKLMPWGNLCYGEYASAQYCGNTIYVSRGRLRGLAANSDHPTVGEFTVILGHEDTHRRDAVSYPGGEGAFFAHLNEDVDNVFASEQSADDGGMDTVQTAVNNGDLPPEAADEGITLLGRIGSKPDQVRERTHGTDAERVGAGLRGVAKANARWTHAFAA